MYRRSDRAYSYVVRAIKEIYKLIKNLITDRLFKGIFKTKL